MEKLNFKLDRQFYIYNKEKRLHTMVPADEEGAGAVYEIAVAWRRAQDGWRPVLSVHLWMPDGGCMVSHGMGAHYMLPGEPSARRVFSKLEAIAAGLTADEVRARYIIPGADRLYDPYMIPGRA